MAVSGSGLQRPKADACNGELFILISQDPVPISANETVTSVTSLVVERPGFY